MSEPCESESIADPDLLRVLERWDSLPDAIRAAIVLLGALRAESPDLARVVEAWPDLSEPVRRAMLAMVDASLHA